MFLYNKNECTYLKTYRSNCFGSKNFSMYANIKLEYFKKMFCLEFFKSMHNIDFSEFQA